MYCGSRSLPCGCLNVNGGSDDAGLFKASGNNDDSAILKILNT